MSTALAGPTALPLVHVEACMGTVFSFRITSPGIDRATMDEVIAWLHAMDAMFSTYRPDSEISRINDGRLRMAAASAEVRDVLAACEDMRAEACGYFDIRADGRRLDPSGYVKGWAVQRAADMLAAAGSVNHCVNGGGDVVCAGRPEPGRGWRIGIADPLRPGTFVMSMEVAGPVAVATSGVAERGIHILDPHTATAAAGTASITVVGADLATVDGYATAAVAMGPDRAANWLADRVGIRALLVCDSGTQRLIGEWPTVLPGCAG